MKLSGPGTRDSLPALRYDPGLIESSSAPEEKTPMLQRFILFLLILSLAAPAAAQSPDLPAAPRHGHRSDALIIRNATVVDGSGTPARGGMTIVIEENRITSMYAEEAARVPGFTAPPVQGDVREIDAEGQYVLPGLINMHAHTYGPWGLAVFPNEYIYKLWLACGVTTVRDVGSVAVLILNERKKSAANEIIAPRIYAYLWFPSGIIGSALTTEASLTEASIRETVRALNDRGADGIKLRGFDREATRIIMDEANRVGLRTAHHVGVENMNAWDNAEFGTTTIEHWYGIPDAAVPGIQDFPADFDHSNELHRFRYAGRLWREADPEKLQQVLQALADADVAWNPTFAIYEASRDLQRAVTHPAFDDYLHPALAAFFEPDPAKHGSFFFGWTSTDEAYWKENYRIWMDAVVDFDRRGGLVTAGEDAGFIYQLFGFCMLRELQLQEEAGFHPVEVIQHATSNGAIALGEGDRLGRLRPGYLADLIIVNGNPMEDLNVLTPRGLHDALDHQGQGGIEWTIKDGIPYHAPTLLKDVREIVAEARQARRE